ncbi:hypothetical protein BGZ58_010183 [Dissophora ornata]|nr:hypothetical protein BGZ58_010183 [Dissophora ornata]
MSVLVCFAMLLHLGTITYLITKNIQANASLSSNSQGIHNPNLLTPRQRRLQTAREISGLLKQQWRPGVFALCLVTIDFIYWLFYFMESKKLIDVGPKTPWFNEWLYCLTQQTKASIVSGILSLSNPTPEQIQMAGMEAQKVCASIATPFVPNFAWAALTDMLPAIFGSVVLGIFGSRSELWQDVRRRLFGRKSSGPTYGYGQNGGQGGFGGSKATSDETPRDSNGEKIFQQVPPRPKHGLPNSGPAAVLSPYNSHTALIPEFGSAISKNSLSRNASAESQDPTRLPVNYRQDMPLPWKSNLRPSDSYNNSRSTTPLDNSNNDSRSTTTFGNPINRSRSTTPLGNPNNGSRSATPIGNMNNGSRSATPIDNTRSRSATPFGSNGSRSTTPQNISRVPTPQSNSRPPTPQLKIDTKKPPVSRSDSVIMPEKRFYNTADIEASPISLVTPPPSYNPNSAGIPNYGGSSGRARGSRGPSPVITSPLTKIGYTPYTYSDLDPQLAVVGEASRVQLNYKHHHL